MVLAPTGRAGTVLRFIQCRLEAPENRPVHRRFLVSETLAAVSLGCLGKLCGPLSITKAPHEF